MTAIEGLDEARLATLVESFYARVRADEELGPIFNDAIGDWPEHLDKLTAFWSSVVLTTGRYKGQPVPAHRKHVSRITPQLFDRWLGLPPSAILPEWSGCIASCSWRRWSPLGVPWRARTASSSEVRLRSSRTGLPRTTSAVHYWIGGR